MKVKNIVTVLFVCFILASCAPATVVVPTEFALPVDNVTPTVVTIPIADNFAFVFQDYSCDLSPVHTPVNILDTTNGTLVHTPLGDTTSITISLQLTNDELESIYSEAVSIGFFEYPSKFVVPDDQVTGRHFPAFSYQLSMTNGEKTNSVTWTDDMTAKPSFIKDDQLRNLVNLINKIIQSHPEIKQLPEPKLFCA